MRNKGHFRFRSYSTTMRDSLLAWISFSRPLGSLVRLRPCGHLVDLMSSKDEDVVEVVTPAAKKTLNPAPPAAAAAPAPAATPSSAPANDSAAAPASTDAATSTAVAVPEKPKTPEELAAEEEEKRRRVKKYVQRKQKQILDDIQADMKAQIAKLRDLRAAGTFDVS